MALAFLPDKLHPEYRHQVEAHEESIANHKAAIKRLKEADRMMYGYYPRLRKEAKYAERYQLKVRIKQWLSNLT